MYHSINLLLFVTVVACAASSVTGSVLVAALLTLAINKPREAELNGRETRLQPRLIVPDNEPPLRAYRHSSVSRPSVLLSDSRRPTRAHDAAQLSVSQDPIEDVSQLSLSLGRDEPDDIDLVDVSMSKVSASFNRALESVKDGLCDLPEAEQSRQSQASNRRRKLRDAKKNECNEVSEPCAPTSDSSSSSFADFDCKIVRRPSGELQPDFFCIPISRVERHLEHHGLRAPAEHVIQSFDRRSSPSADGDGPHGSRHQAAFEVHDPEQGQCQVTTAMADEALPRSPPPPRSLLPQSVMRHRVRSGRYSLPLAADLVSPKHPRGWSSPPPPLPASRFGYDGPAYGSLSANNLSASTAPRMSTPPHSRFAAHPRPAPVTGSHSERASPRLSAAAASGPRRAHLQQHARSFSTRSVPAQAQAQPRSNLSGRSDRGAISPFLDTFLSTPRTELEEEIRTGLEDQSHSLSRTPSDLDFGGRNGSYGSRQSLRSESSGSDSPDDRDIQGSGQFMGVQDEEAEADDFRPRAVPPGKARDNAFNHPTHTCAHAHHKVAGNPTYGLPRTRARTLTREAWPRERSPLAGGDED